VFVISISHNRYIELVVSSFFSDRLNPTERDFAKFQSGDLAKFRASNRGGGGGGGAGGGDRRRGLRWW
jgi:hypothetical protein